MSAMHLVPLFSSDVFTCRFEYSTCFAPGCFGVECRYDCMQTWCKPLGPQYSFMVLEIRTSAQAASAFRPVRLRDLQNGRRNPLIFISQNPPPLPPQLYSLCGWPWLLLQGWQVQNCPKNRTRVLKHGIPHREISRPTLSKGCKSKAQSAQVQIGMNAAYLDS